MEIFFPEVFIVLFLALPLFRPFVKGLVPMDGLAWLPFIAMGLTVGIFPAYGFRPECLPILVFAFVYSAAHLFRPKDSFRDRGLVSTLCAFIVLGAAAFTMFAFSSKFTTLSDEAGPVTEIKITDWITGPAGIYNRDYFLRLYDAVQSGHSRMAERPLVFIIPPEIGSAASVDLVCRELQKKDLTVVSYSYKDHYPQKKRSGFSKGHAAYWRMSRRAAEFVSANEQGKTLEAERRAEIEFLLPRLSVALRDPSVRDDARHRNLSPLLLVGYGAGGSALAYLAGNSDFFSRYDNVLGMAAIESRLWSSYLPEVHPNLSMSPISDTPSLQWISVKLRYLFNSLESTFKNMLPKRVSRSGPLPNTGGLPVLYLVSGRALDYPKGQQSYQAVFDSVRFSSGPNALAALEGAGPLDYQDYPLTHPLYSFLFPGLKDAVKSENPIGDTASIIANYAAFLQENVSRETSPISGSLYVESKGLPGFGLE